MSTFHQQLSDGSFELYDNSFNKGLRPADLASPPGGPTFHPPINVHQSKELERLNNELLKSHHEKFELGRMVSELENRLQNSNISENGLDDFKDARIRHLDREKTILQANLAKKQRHEQRMMELTQENNVLKDQLFISMSEVSKLKGIIRELETKVKVQKDTNDRLSRDKEFSLLRKGDNSDTPSPPQSSSSSSQSISPPASSSLPSTGAASVGSDGSYSQELEHLHAMVDMLRNTVMEQRSVFLKMGLQAKMMNSMSQSASSQLENSSRYPISQPHTNQPPSSHNTSLLNSVYRFPPSLTNRIPPQSMQQEQQPRQAEENSVKQLSHLTGRKSSSNIDPVVSNYFTSPSDIDLSTNEKIPRSVVLVATGDKVNFVYNTSVIGNPNPSVVHSGSNVLDSVKNVLSSVSNAGNSTSAVNSPEKMLPSFSRVKDGSNCVVSVASLVASESGGKRSPSQHQHQKPVVAVSGAAINDGTMVCTNGLNMTTNAEPFRLDSTNDSCLVYENVSLSGQLNRDDENCFLDARTSNEYENTKSDRWVLNAAELNDIGSSPLVCSPTVITQVSHKLAHPKSPVYKKTSVTEIIRPSSPLINPADLPPKCVTEIVSQSGRSPGHQHLHPNQRQRQKSHEMKDEKFQVQYPPDMQELSPNLDAFPNSEIKTAAAGMGPSSPQRFLRNNSNCGSSSTSLSEQWSQSNIQHPVVATAQQVVLPTTAGGNQSRLWTPVPLSTSNSNTLSNITDVTSSYNPYIPNRVEIPTTQTRINNSSMGGSYLRQQSQLQELQLQQQPQQQHYNNSNYNSNGDNNAQDDNRLCPVCHVNFPSISMEEYQTHVYECFDNENGPETLQADHQSVEVNLADFNRQSRSCPMCQQKFALSVSQTEFETHVHRHFGEENFEMMG